MHSELAELAKLFREHAGKDEGNFTKRLVEIIGNPRVIESLNYQELLVTSLKALRLPLDEEIAKEPNSDPAVLEKMQVDIGAVGLTNLVSYWTGKKNSSWQLTYIPFFFNFINETNLSEYPPYNRSQNYALY